MKQTDYETVARIIREADAEDLEEIEGLIKTQWVRIELERLNSIPGPKWAPWEVQMELANKFFESLTEEDRPYERIA